MPVRIGDDAANLLPWQYSRPGQLRQEYIVDAVLQAAMTPADEIRRLRPQVPQQLDPPTQGYRRVPLTIEDVLATDRWAPQRRSWVSGAPSIPLRDEQIEGSAGLRNFNVEGLV